MTLLQRFSLRRVNLPALMVAGFMAGLASSHIAAGRLSEAPVAAVAVFVFIAAILGRRQPLAMVALAAAGFILTGIVAGCLRLDSLGHSDLEQLAGRRVTLELSVDKTPRERSGKVSFYASVERGEYRGEQLKTEEKVLVDLYCDDACVAGDGGISEGMRFRITGTVRRPDSRPGADFDYGEYLARRGIHVVVGTEASRVEALSPRKGAAGAVDQLRRHARDSLGAGSWGAAGGLYRGMVLGDVSDVPETVSDDMRDAGLLHLVAVSGQNVVLLAFAVMLICRALRCSRTAAALVAMGVVAVYIPLTGADASILRAGCVGMLGLLAFLLGSRAGRFYLLSLSAAVLLSLNPNALFEPGFQLSYAAVLGIFYLMPALVLVLRFLPGLLAEAAAVSAAAGLATAPITLAHFQQVSLMTVPANIMAAPVAGPVMLLGTMSIVAAPFSGAVSRMLNIPAVACAGYVVEVAGFFASLPGAVHVAPVPGMLAIAAFYGMLASMAFAIHKSASLGLFRTLVLFRRWAVPALVVLALVAFACFGGGGAEPPSAYTISFLDVGQGDAILVQVPGGATVLVDGGPGSSVIEQLEESGVERIDAVIVSHAHADHIAGLLPVLEKYDVGTVYDSGAPSSSPVYLDLLRLIERRGIEYRAVRQGDMLSFGDLSMEVLSPGLDLAPDDINADSLVIVAGFQGLDVLLPGDAESDVLGALDLPAVEVLKVSHHGSSDEGLERFLARIEPEIAVIMVGDGNDYGHPHGSTLDALRAAGVELYRTDRDGTIRVSLDGDGMAVSTGS